MYIFGCAPREKLRCPRLTIAISELNRFVTSPFSLSLSFILLSATVGKSDSFFFFFQIPPPIFLNIEWSPRSVFSVLRFCALSRVISKVDPN